MCFKSFYFLLPLFRSLMYGIILDKIFFLFCVQSVREFTLKLFTLKIVLLVVGDWYFSCFRLLMSLLPFEIFIEFGLPLRPRETDWRSGSGCWWSSSRSMKIGHWWFEVLRWIRLKNVVIYHCRWRLGMLDLTQNWFEMVFQAFDFSSQKNRLVMIEWNCQFS